jgi:uncharacterized membrane-anchored protein YhcB (DUF1043 family)
MIEFLKKSWKKILITFGLIAGMIVSVLAFVFSNQVKNDEKTEKEIEKIKKAKNETENIVHNADYLDFNNDGTLKRNPASK